MGWKVTAQKMVTDLDAQGQQVDGLQVFYATDRGEHGSIRLPFAQANPDTVRAMIDRHVQRFDDIAGLEG